MSEITVVPWGTRAPLPNDATAPMHDCLWEIAWEQAILDRMKRTNEKWEVAADNVTDKDIRAQLDTICNENGFRRIDGSGSGRNPHLINDGDTIKVRIDPRVVGTPPAGITEGRPSGNSYTGAVTGQNGNLDVTKRQQLDSWLATIPGFDGMQEEVKAAVIDAYVRGVDPKKLGALVTSDGFENLDREHRIQLLKVYGAGDQPLLTSRVDGLIAGPVAAENENLLVLLSTPGFAKLSQEQQTGFLERYQNEQFRKGIDDIIEKGDFERLSADAQAHALDVLRRYSFRKKDGYGYRDPIAQPKILVGLFDRVLMHEDYKLGEVNGTQENSTQADMIKDFAEGNAIEYDP